MFLESYRRLLETLVVVPSKSISRPRKVDWGSLKRMWHIKNKRRKLENEFILKIRSRKN